MATITEDDVLSGTIHRMIKKVPEAKLRLKPEINVSNGDLVAIQGIYTSDGSTSETYIYKGLIDEVDYIDVQKISTYAKSDELNRSPTATYYGRLGGLIQDLLDNECDVITHSFSSSSPYVYRAPYNWRNLADGPETDPDWVSSGSGGSFDIIASSGTHKKVLDISKDATSNILTFKRTFSPLHEVGDIELYIKMDYNSKVFFHLWDAGLKGLSIKWEDGTLYYLTGATTYTSITTYSGNIWYHYRISYDWEGHWHLWINDVSQDGGSGYSFYPVPTSEFEFAQFNINQNNVPSSYHLYLDAIGDTEDGNYEVGYNKLTEYDQLDYSGQFQKWELKADKSIVSFLNTYSEALELIWYLDANDEIFINDLSVDSGVDISASTTTWNKTGKRQVKTVDIVELKGAYVGGARLVSTAGSGTILYRDIYADVTDQTTLDLIAANILTNKASHQLTVKLKMSYESVGMIQEGENITINSGIFFTDSNTEIPSGNYIIREIKYYLKDGKYEYVDLTLDSGLVWTRRIDTSLPQENSSLISGVGTAASQGEANTGQNIGTDGVGVYSGKSGATLQFRHIAPASSKITVTLNGNDIDIDVGTIPLVDLGSYVKGRLIIGGDSDWDYLIIGTAGYFLKSVSGKPAWAAITEADISDFGSYLENLSEDSTPELGGILGLLSYGTTANDADIQYYFGRGIIGYNGASTDNFCIGHRDVMSGTQYSFRCNITDTYVNAAGAGAVYIAVQGTNKLNITSSGLQVGSDARITEFDTDTTLVGGDTKVPTSAAVKNYADNHCELSKDLSPELGADLNLGSYKITSSDTNTYHILGRAWIGYDGAVGTAAGFGHWALRSSSQFAIEQLSTGEVYVNCPSGKSIYFSVGGTGNVYATINSSGLQLGGELDLNAKGIAVDGTPASDHTYEGIIIEIDTTGCSNYQAVYCDGANSVLPADADAITTMLCIGVVVDTGKVLTHGVIRDDTWSDLTAGEKLYVSTTAGIITDTAPSASGNIVQCIGIALGTGILLINPSMDWVEIV